MVSPCQGWWELQFTSGRLVLGSRRVNEGRPPRREVRHGRRRKEAAEADAGQRAVLIEQNDERDVSRQRTGSCPTTLGTEPGQLPGSGSVDERLGERRPGLAGDPFLAERLEADVIGAGVEMGAHGLGDLLGAALRDDGVDEPG